MLDFKELGGKGRGLEQLVRELLLIMDLHPEWSGEGPDGGRDLTFVEPGMELLGSKGRTWLVSCKDNSVAGGAVGAAALEGFIEAVEQHNAQAFLLVCTTHPSAAVTARLEGVETNRRLPCHVWDGVTLERLLNTPTAWPLAQRFMPISAEAQDWKLFGTDYPNSWIAVHRGQFIQLSARTGSGMGYDLRSLSDRFDELEAARAGREVEFRVREIWHDDTHGGGYRWSVDCLYDRTGPEPNVEALMTVLRSGISRDDGQFHTFDITPREVNRMSDHFDRDHYSFYRRHRR